MAKTITLKFPGRCADCGADLPVGSKARWYGRGRVFGIGCHEKPVGAVESLFEEPEPLGGYGRGGLGVWEVVPDEAG